MYRICHLTSAHKQNDVRIFHKECVSLAQRPDFDVYLVAEGESREQDGVHVIGVGKQPAGRKERATSFAKKVYEAALALDADIYHFHDPELLPTGRKLAGKGKAVVFDSHENTSEQLMIRSYIPLALRKAISGAYRAYERSCVRKFEGVIYPESPTPFDDFARRVAVVDNTPRLSEFYDRYEEREGVPGNVVCHVGSLDPERGVPQLIKGCYKAGAKLILAGTFETEEYRKRIMEDESFSCVDYRGYVDRSRVIDIYRESSIGASTLLNIGQYVIARNLPTKVYECMAMGLPLIMSDTPYAREITGKYDFAVLVDPSDPDSIAEGIKRLSEDGNARKRMALEARRAVRERFNWAVDEAALFKLYDDILERRK